MSTFAFNFLDSDSTEKDTSTLPTPTTPIVPPVLYSPPTNPLNYPSTPLLAYPSISLTHSSTISSLPSTHDLVPGFEGGHKTWESSVDLLDVLGDCKGGTILELGEQAKTRSELGAKRRVRMNDASSSIRLFAPRYNQRLDYEDVIL